MAELEEPDKGRAWLIAIAACIINMILSGLSRMIAILYVYIIDAYGVTREEATMPFAIRNSIRMLSGPLVGIIGQRFGIRAVTFWGGVIASTGAALCYIAPSITWLAVFWGGVHGFGFAFANTLFQVAVNQYFQKYRATASGIALSGACIGSLAFPIMIEAILETYGLSGGFLILGGVIMHVLPFALFLCSPEWVEYPKAYARLWALKNASKSVDTVHTVDVEESVPQEKDSFKNLSRATSMTNDPVETVDICRQNMQTDREEVIFTHADACTRTRSGSNVICILYRSKASPKVEKKNGIQNGHVRVNNASSGVYSISGQLSEQTNVSESTADSANTQTISQSLKSIMKLYTNPVYVLISLCMATYVFIFLPMMTVIVDYGMDKGIPESYGKYLINAMAIGDLTGRLCFGWVTDEKFMTIPVFMTTILVLEGVFIALFPLAMSIYTFTVLLVLYSMMAGSILVLFPVLVLQYVDLNAQSVAMACVGFVSGIVSLGVPPMIGHFRDVVGSYDGMFYLTGAISVISGCIWLLEPIVAKFHYGKKETDQEGKTAETVQSTTETEFENSDKIRTDNR